MQAFSAANGRVDDLEDGEPLRELSVTIPHIDCSRAEPRESVGLLSTAADVHGVPARGDARANKAASHTTPETDRTQSTWPPAGPAASCNDAAYTPNNPNCLPCDAPAPQLADCSADRFEVCLERASRDTSFGMQVAAYSGFIDTKPFNGIYVKSIVPDSPAALTTQMCVNDRIVAVNSIDITALSNEEAISLLRQQLREDLSSMLVLERLRTGSVLDSIQSNNSDELIASTVRDGETTTQTVCDAGQIHQEAAENVEEAKHNAAPLCRFEKDDSAEKELLELQQDGKIHPDVVKALQLTWADILGYDVDIVVVQFHAQPTKALATDNPMQQNGLGLALNVNTSGLVRYFVSNVDCDGPSVGKLQCGDEILEINGRKVRQLPEEELVTLLRTLGDDVRVVAARSIPERDDKQCTDLQQQADATVNNDTPATQQQAIEQVSSPTNCLVNSMCEDAAERQQRSFTRISRSKSETNLSLRNWSANTTNQCSPKRLPSIQKAVRRLQAKSTSPRRRAATHSRRHRKKDTDRATSIHKPVATISKQNTRMLPLEVLMKDYNIQPLIGLAIWTREPVIIDLFKSSNSGLGFSVAEYRDPFNPIKPIIVVRSLVPRGVADADGRLLPGDRLLFVNETQVDSCTLDEALRVLRNLPSGVVRLGVAKPLPITNQDALVDMTAPCEGMQDGAFQQYASLLANPVAGATGSAMRRKPKRRDTSKKAAAREGDKFKECDQSQGAVTQRPPVADVPIDTSSAELQRPASPNSALQRDVPESTQQYGGAGSRSVAGRTNGTDDAVDNISESRISSVSIGFGGMTSMCSDSDMTLSDVCRPDYRKLQSTGKCQPDADEARLCASQDRDCPSINGDQSDWKNEPEPAWSPPLGQQPPSLSASASVSNSDSVQGRSRCDEFASPTQQSETVVLIDAADSSAASPHSQSRSRKWPDQSMDAPVSNASGRNAKPHSRASVSTTFTSTETDTADESNAFRVRRPRTPTPSRSQERLPSRNTHTRRLMRAATCDYHDEPPQCQHLAHCSKQSQIRRQRIHNSEDTLNVNRRRHQRVANSSPQRNVKQLAPGTVVTAFLFKSELGLGFSVCKRLVNALPCVGACTSMSPNHSGESTPRPTTIYVKDIASRSPAWNDGTLEPGDQILKINRFDVSSVGYKEALKLLRSTVGEVEITVLKQPLKMAERPNLLSDQMHFSPVGNESCENNFESEPNISPPWYVGNLEYDPRSIELRDGKRTWIWLQKSEAAANCGLGLSIAALAKRGALQDQLSLTDSIVITAIQPNSVSALDGRLRLGDRIWQIDEYQLSGIPAEEAIRILKEKSRNSKEVYLYVERYVRHSVVHADSSSHCRFATEIFEVDIWKPQNGGIGILISGTGENGILVTGIVPRSVAESNGLICVGDVMLELNGIDVTRFRQEEVATLLKNAQGLLTFKFKRTVTVEQSSLRSHSGSVASIPASMKALRESEVMPSTATNTHSSNAVSRQCSSEELQPDVRRPVNFTYMHKSPSSGSFSKHVYAKRKLKSLRKRARSVSPKRTLPSGNFPRDRNKSEDEACESENTCLWQTILTPLNRIKYSIFPSFTAKSADDTPLSNNTEEDRCVENEYSLSDVFVMRDRSGQLGFGVTGGKTDDSSYWLEELAVLHQNKMANLPVVVTSIVKEGPADRSRQIEVGDRIVLINNQSVDGLAHEQVVQRLRGPPQTPIHFRLERAHEKSRLMRLWPNKGKKSQPRRPGVWKVTFERTMAKGLGFCIMGGYDEISGRFVPFVIKAVFPQSPAAKYGLRPGDQLLSVNGTSLENELHETAVNLLKNPKEGKTTLLLLTV